MSSDSTSPSRRRFLKLSLAVAPAAAAAGCGNGDRGTAATDDYRPAFFDVAEWTFLRAALARLIPADARGPGALEAGVPEYIDRQMATPWAHGQLWYMRGPFQPEAAATLGYQLRLAPREIYRLGIAEADAACRDRHGKPFAELAPAQQDAVLGQLEQGAIAFDALPSKTFFALLLGNAREGFFCDPQHGGNRGLAGWKLIGFPGARADFMDWVERDVAYPLPPVAIDGTRG